MQPGGRRFESDHLHGGGVYRGWVSRALGSWPYGFVVTVEIRVPAWPVGIPYGGVMGLRPVVSARVTGRVVFVSVNQVLVRLWACCQGGVVHNRFLRSREV